MFNARKKNGGGDSGRIKISEPSNFEHRVHTGFDANEGRFTGLPVQWQSLIPEHKEKRKPVIDADGITPIPNDPVGFVVLIVFYLIIFWELFWLIFRVLTSCWFNLVYILYVWELLFFEPWAVFLQSTIFYCDAFMLLFLCV